MFGTPLDPESNSSRTSQSAIARWAREEAKSDAMVDDVLTASGVAPDALTNNAPLQRLPLAALALIGAGVLASTLAVAALALSLPRGDSGAAGDHLATEAPRGSVRRDPPRYWGPYHP